MNVAGVALPDLDELDSAALKALLLEQHERLIDKDEQLLAKDDQLRLHRLEIDNLKLLIAKLRRLQFGQKSEKYTQQIEQLELRLEELETADAQINAASPQASDAPQTRAPQKPRRSFPDHLPRETQTIAPQHDACPDCGGTLKHLSDDIREPANAGAEGHRPRRYSVECPPLAKSHPTGGTLKYATPPIC